MLRFNIQKDLKYFLLNLRWHLLIENYKKLANDLQNKFKTLKDYYFAILVDNEETENLWKLYLLTIERVSESENNYQTTLDAFIKAQNQFNANNWY